MANSRHFVVLGLGNFGSTIARRLSENGCRVTGVDCDRPIVEQFKDELYEAVIADVTEHESLEHLAIDSAEGVVISLGERLSRSLLAALHAKELGAKRIYVKGTSDEHGRLLKHLGVDQVIFPDYDTARNLADKLTWPNVIDFLPIDPEYSVVELAVPSSVSGQTIREAELRRRFDVLIIGLRDVLQDKMKFLPDPDQQLTDDQALVVVGRQSDLDRLRELE